MSTTISKSNGSNNYYILFIVLFGIITIILWQFMPGRWILYPFTILGTWFHEMAHGMAALLLGGDFIRLEINTDGSGVAVHTQNSFLGNPGRAVIAGAGPLGPTFAGFIFLITSTNHKVSRVILFLLSIFMILSCLLWVRSLVGVGIILLFGVLIFLISLKATDNFQKLTLQFLGVQAFASLYLSIGYLFSRGAIIGSNTLSSDTEVMAQNLLLPFWFWAILILLISLILFIISIIKIK